MSKITLQTSVADIVTIIPRAADLFRQLRIDYCCGGKESLELAAIERKLDPKQVLEEVEKIGRQQAEYESSRPQSQDEAELIRYIQQKHHAFLREELPQLTPYITKVARVHGEYHPHLLRVQELFTALKQELLEHTEEEDQVVFPLLLQYVNHPEQATREQLMPYLLGLEDDHDGAGNLLKELRDITHDYEPPADACGTYRLVYQRLSLLEQDTFEHIHLENHVLFEQVRSILTN
ncbi:iron-sulfur cluster repair di-iron protein [Paenibacillus marinisediminis]